MAGTGGKVMGIQYLANFCWFVGRYSRYLNAGITNFGYLFYCSFKGFEGLA